MASRKDGRGVGRNLSTRLQRVATIKSQRGYPVGVLFARGISAAYARPPSLDSVDEQFQKAGVQAVTLNLTFRGP
jgi:hypothetical protein